MDWATEAEKLRFELGYSWTKTANELKHLFPDLTDQQVLEKIRGKLRKSKKYKPTQRKITDEQILSVLKIKRTPQQDADILHTDLKTFLSHIEKLSQKHNIVKLNGMIWLEKSPVIKDNETKAEYNGETVITFALVSDTHLCNKAQQLTHLNSFYDLCQKKGIKTVYHCGDISDGYYKHRPAHIYELFRIGADEQAEYIIKNYPRRNGVETVFITGNHDATHVMNGGTDIGKKISDNRPDMKYLGYMKAKVWLTPQCDMDLFHPTDGSSYAISYKPQKHIEGMQGGKKPRILATGHYHKQLYLDYRNVHALLVPSFEAQTDFVVGHNLNTVVGGWVVTIKCKPDGTITEFLPQFIPYYDMIESDY